MPKIEDNLSDKSFMVIDPYHDNGMASQQYVNIRRLGQIRVESPKSPDGTEESSTNEEGSDTKI